LQRQIAVTHFADVDVGREDEWTRELQYLGARGFFPDYKASPDQPVTAAIAAAWEDALSRALGDDNDANTIAKRVAATRHPGTTGSERAGFRTNDPAAALLRRWGWNGRPPETTREACHILCGALREAEAAGLSA